MSPEQAPERAEWMSVLAKAPAGRLVALWSATGLAPEHDWLRRPETGAVMVRGRAGGSGAPFNLGEMTVTRCALRLESGEVGHAWVQGRDKEKARLAALCDALMATPARARVEAAVLGPLRAEAAERARGRAARAAATRVDFFTLVRGEDA
jgi:alpha-D-ribose 1-methylphosphonate 5-triphosphate synthase subunit PhnG